MVGLLVADKTPVKSKKEVSKSKRAKMSVRHDATDSEEDDRMTNMGHTPVTHVNSNASKDKKDKKETKSALPSKISLPKDVAYLRRYRVQCVYHFHCRSFSLSLKPYWRKRRPKTHPVVMATPPNTML